MKFTIYRDALKWKITFLHPVEVRTLILCKMCVSPALQMRPPLRKGDINWDRESVGPTLSASEILFDFYIVVLLFFLDFGAQNGGQNQ